MRASMILYDEPPTRGMSMFQILEMMQCLFPVEQPDVSRLSRRQSSHCPAPMNEVRLNWRVDRMHSDFTRKAVRFARIAGAARSHNVRPLVRPAARERHEMISRQRFARLELELHPPAVLTAVAISRKKKRVRNLTTESPRYVNETREADDGGARERQPLRAYYTLRVGLDNLGLSVDHQPESAPHGHHRQGLERCV
jgi:hypothetical protein